MAKRRIIWTKTAVEERREILNYWNNRNRSKTYSRKLNKLFSEAAMLLSKHPEIVIQSVWDTRRDDKNK